MKKDISRTLLPEPPHSQRPPWPIQIAGSVPSLPTLPSMGGPCPRGSELDPEALRGRLWARGHADCPVNGLSPGQCPVTPSACFRSRSWCMSQESSHVPGPPVGPPGFTAAEGLRPPGVVSGLQCPVCGVSRVSPGRTSESLFLLLVWGTPVGSVLI